MKIYTLQEVKLLKLKYSLCFLKSFNTSIKVTYLYNLEKKLPSLLKGFYHQQQYYAPHNPRPYVEKQLLSNILTGSFFLEISF